MSGGDYVENFGNRMKDFRRRKRTPQAHRAPLWIRFRKTWGTGMKKRGGPWIYCWWTRPLGGIREFVKAEVGSFRQIQYLDPKRPEIGDAPFRILPSGMELFLEKSL